MKETGKPTRAAMSTPSNEDNLDDQAAFIADRAREIIVFTNKAMATPKAGQFVWWKETAYAALFSSSFEIAIILFVAQDDPSEKVIRDLNTFVGELSKQSSCWMARAYMGPFSLWRLFKPKKSEDEFTQEIQERLSSYFDVAIKAMADIQSEMDLHAKTEFARSHSCFVILKESSKRLVRGGVPFSAQKFNLFFTSTLSLCDSLANDIHQYIVNLEKSIH